MEPARVTNREPFWSRPRAAVTSRETRRSRPGIIWRLRLQPRRIDQRLSSPSFVLGRTRPTFRATAILLWLIIGLRFSRSRWHPIWISRTAWENKSSSLLHLTEWHKTESPQPRSTRGTSAAQTISNKGFRLPIIISRAMLTFRRTLIFLSQGRHLRRIW